MRTEPSSEEQEVEDRITKRLQKLDQLADEPDGTLVLVTFREETNNDLYLASGHLLYDGMQKTIMLQQGVAAPDPTWGKSADLNSVTEIPVGRFKDYEILTPTHPTKE